MLIPWLMVGVVIIVVIGDLGYSLEIWMQYTIFVYVLCFLCLMIESSDEFEGLQIMANAYDVF